MSGTAQPTIGADTCPEVTYPFCRLPSITFFWSHRLFTSETRCGYEYGLTPSGIFFSHSSVFEEDMTEIWTPPKNRKRSSGIQSLTPHEAISGTSLPLGREDNSSQLGLPPPVAGYALPLRNLTAPGHGILTVLPFGPGTLLSKKAKKGKKPQASLNSPLTKSLSFNRLPLSGTSKAFARPLGPTTSLPFVVLVKPFPTTALEPFIRVFATTTEICTSD